MFWGRYLILAVLKKVKNQLRRRGKSLEMHFQKEIFLLMILLQQRRICSKYSGDVVTNTEAAKRYSRFAVGQDAIPLAPHLLLPLYMKEESERELAMFMDMVLLGRCDELWVFGGEASAGMCAEIAKAKRHGKKIRYFDSLCNETNRALEIGPERLQEER